MNDAERLRRFIVNADGVNGDRTTSSRRLDRRTIALVRLGALCAIGAPTLSIRAEVDAAIAAGVTDSEMIDVVAEIVPIVGLPRAVSAAPSVALALGYDLDLLTDHSA
ncbi:carboxymuconolactone decarboxylase family protein [Agromyces cerinus]|uniref:Carboxymuconolactone decarboxylase family protein n=1 Tax=Agromyces cerinus subsp. cerinus TaxID=232089 RepID=A0A1N6DW36_9MICO|nr:carboxymuconolactone decarboxylase family protein [Agromyces cerinus]SIN75005.1 Carboxymuconolactone decarboxylase family protein [Agromyces cerinus subsp. cerinus]